MNMNTKLEGGRANKTFISHRVVISARRLLAVSKISFLTQYLSSPQTKGYRVALFKKKQLRKSLARFELATSEFAIHALYLN